MYKKGRAEMAEPHTHVLRVTVECGECVISKHDECGAHVVNCWVFLN